MTECRVIYVIPGAVYGGAHNQVSRLHSQLANNGCTATVVMPNEPGNAEYRLRSEGLNVVSLTMRRIRALSNIRENVLFLAFLPIQMARMARLFRKLHADVVQVHGVTQFDIAISAKLAGAGIIWQLLDTRAPEFLCRVLRPFLLTIPDVLMSTGRGTLRTHLGSGRSSQPVILYVPPVRSDLEPVTPVVRKAAREELGLQECETLVISIGNFNPQKGFQTLVRAFAHADVSGSRLHIRGTRSDQHPELVDDLALEAVSLGLGAETVEELKESGPSVPTLMAAADVFCLSAEPRSEGLPTVIVEAMRCGLPILASDVGSISEALHHGKNGLLHPSRDVIQLSKDICAVLEDQEARRRFARQSAILADDLADPEKFVRANLNAIEIAAGRR